MDRDWNALYRLQDRVLMHLKRADHGFYLTGGTALSRGYYRHRYSDDLDFFVIEKPEAKEYAAGLQGLIRGIME